MKVTKSEPELTGPYGKAWEHDTFAIKQNTKVSISAALVAWIIFCPKAHPIFKYYSLTLIHLRSMPNFPDPNIYLPGATHEFLLSVLSPDVEPDTEWPPKLLSPSNFGAQMIYKDDKEAVKQIEWTVRDIINGRLNPDSDNIKSWAIRFNDSMLVKA